MGQAGRPYNHAVQVLRAPDGCRVRRAFRCEGISCHRRHRGYARSVRLRSGWPRTCFNNKDVKRCYLIAFEASKPLTHFWSVFTMNLVCPRRNHMTHKVARMGLMFVFALLIAVPFPLLAQTQSDDNQSTSDKNSKSDAKSDSKSDSKSKDKKDKDDKSKGKKPKNADVDNIGARNINKGSVNFYSLDKEIAMGRQLAAEVERQVKLVEDPAINEYVNRVGQNIVRNSDA